MYLQTTHGITIRNFRIRKALNAENKPGFMALPSLLRFLFLPIILARNLQVGPERGPLLEQQHVEAENQVEAD